jgi:nucleotide-binding universal stress UspA family protein
MFHKILVAVDGSLHADMAPTHAIDLAECGHSRLTLFTAIAPQPPTAYWVLPAAAMAGFFDDAEADAERVARRARDRVPSDLPITAILTRQPV